MSSHGSGFVLAGRYALREAVGEGGFAKVYRARDTEIDEIIAVKVPNHEGSNNDRKVIDQYFGHEARTLERIEAAGGHPNLVTLHDRGTENGTEYLVVQYIDGYDLDEAIERTGPLGENLAEQVRQVGIDLCDAMSFLHESEIVYRDLKPDNVMLTSRDGWPRPVLIDFNTATNLDADGLARDGETTIMGPYKAPEIADADRDVRQGPWSDVYSIGKILLFLLQGTVPREDGVNPRTLGVDCDPYLAATVEKATRTAHDRRFRNATSMKRVLEAGESGTVAEATLVDLETGERHAIEPGDTVGRRNAAGGSPSIVLEDGDKHVSAIQAEFDVAESGSDDWSLRDYSLNGTYVRSDGTWQRVLCEEGRERLREHGADPTDSDGEVPPSRLRLSDGDLVALVHPSYGFTFRFEACG